MTDNNKQSWLRTFVFVIGITFVVVQTGFLVVNFLLIANSDDYIRQITDWFIDRGVRTNLNSTIPAQTDDNAFKEYVVKKSSDYLAIPVTVNVVLIIADSLLIWATSARNKLLLLPWMVLHAIEFLFFIACLIFLLVVLDEPWIKVVIFLLGCPVIILLGFFWFVVNCFHVLLSDLNLKEAVAAVYHNSQLPAQQMNHPSTMYTPEPHHWDQPIPVWAIKPPQAAWDPEYLQSLDPRYMDAMRLTAGRYRKESNRRREHRPTRHRPVEQTLPDGTIVVPIMDDDDCDFDAYTTSEYLKRKDHQSSDEEGKAHYGSMRSLSSKYRVTPGQRASRDEATDDAGTVIALSTTDKPMSDDRSSIMSLSDKYRTQEEIEIFQGRGYKPPPEPIRPKANESQPASRHTNEESGRGVAKLSQF